MKIDKISLKHDFKILLERDENPKNPRKCDKNTWKILSFDGFKRISPDKHDYANFDDFFHKLTVRGTPPQKIKSFTFDEITEICERHGYFLVHILWKTYPFTQYFYDNRKNKSYIERNAITIAFTELNDTKHNLLNELETELYLYNCYKNGFVYKFMVHDFNNLTTAVWHYNKYLPKDVCSTKDITQLLLDEYKDGYFKYDDFIDYDDFILSEFAKAHNEVRP